MRRRAILPHTMSAHRDKQFNLIRDHADPHAAGLPPLLVDRQRVVHSSAFRRLQHKTQVFVLPIGDHFRTRLTHTLEVAHLSRVLAVQLNLNADLAETVALAHDLGHPPFGHAGEQALNNCLAGEGGFEHNQHTLRVVEVLEHPYPDFLGLNLTRAVRECLAKHSTQFDDPGEHPLQDGQPPPMEGRIVDLADRLAYALHDLQDGLYAGQFNPAGLNDLTIWRAAYDGPALDAPDAWRGHLRPTIDRIQRRVLDNVFSNVRSEDGSASLLSDEIESYLAELDRFLYEQLYRSPALQQADEHALRILTAVFEHYRADPELLPPRFHKRVETQGVNRVVTDYVAGMTDRFCLQSYEDLPDTAAAG